MDWKILSLGYTPHGLFIKKVISMKRKIVAVFLLFHLLLTPAWAAFVAKKISIEGLQRVSEDTLYSYLPIKKGQPINSDKTTDIIKTLYNTGFFERITLSRRGDTLIIHVVERPTIGDLKISGNSIIPTDKLTAVMKSVDIAEGRIYNAGVLDKIIQSLLNQYYQLGRYNAHVDVSVTPQARNRVAVRITISEGLVAKVKHINIIGNHAFNDKTLKKQLSLTSSGLLTVFTQNDSYSQEKLDASLDSLRNYYLDHGYLKFAVKSSQTAITPDRKSIFITIVIEEGVPYRIKGYTLSGNLILPSSELISRMTIHANDIFSRQAVVDSEKAVSNALGDKGYLFAVVSLQPTIDDTTRQVFLHFHVNPGRRVYVRHIYFSENSKTNDEALRREIEQMESSVVSTKQLEQSKQSLSLLPYIKDVQMSIIPVPHSDDQVDVNYKVTEDSAAQATFTVGYSQVDHIILSAGLNQKNFLGTGETLGLNFSRSRYQKYYGMNFTDPYYTIDGISRTISFYASTFTPGNANVANSYTSSDYGASVVYGIPIGWEKGGRNNVQLGYGYEDTIIGLTNRFSNTIDQQVNDFVTRHGTHFQQLDLIAGITRDSRDKAIFPTRGMMQSLGFNGYFPINKSLSYYTLAYDAKWYYPLSDKFITTAHGDLGYGNSFNGISNYPFFKNYYAGGIGSVRGFTGNTLGPQDARQNPFGGNALITGNLGLIFPNGISDNFRTTAFIDVGNVYNTYDNRKFGGTGSGPLRYSTGIEGDWLTPMGMIDVCLAKPLNPKPGDSTRTFDFSLGANFG